MALPRMSHNQLYSPEFPSLPTETRFPRKFQYARGRACLCQWVSDDGVTLRLLSSVTPILRAEFSFSPRLPSLNVCVYLLIFPPNLLVPQHPVSSTEVLSSDAGHSPAACVKPHPSTPPQPTSHQDFAFPGHRTVHPQPVLALQTAVLSSLMARHLPASSAIRVTASRPPVTRHTPSSIPPASLCSGWCHC